MAQSREIGALGQKTVTGMHRIAPGRACRGHDRLRIEISRSPLAGECMRLIGHTDMQTVDIVTRIDRHRADTEVGCRARNANRDLAAVGNQNPGNHRSGHLLRCRRRRAVSRRW